MIEIDARKITPIVFSMSNMGRQEKDYIGEIAFGAVAMALAIGFIGFIIDAPLTRLARNLDPEMARNFEVGAVFFSPDALLLAGGATFVLAFALSFGVSGFRSRAAWGILAQRTAFICICVCLAVFFVQLLKFGVGRRQPQYFDSYGAFRFSAFFNGTIESSFPSGHATAIFAFATGLALFLPRFSIVFMMIALALSASRVIAGAHYPSDILGGMVLGIVLTIGTARIIARLDCVFRLTDGYLVRRGEGLVGDAFRGVFRLRKRPYTNRVKD